MSARQKQSLWLAIDVLEAQETLNLIKATTYAKLKDSDRSTFDSKLKSKAYPEDIYGMGKSIDLKDSFLYKLKRAK